VRPQRRISEGPVILGHEHVPAENAERRLSAGRSLAPEVSPLPSLELGGHLGYLHPSGTSERRRCRRAITWPPGHPEAGVEPSAGIEPATSSLQIRSSRQARVHWSAPYRSRPASMPDATCPQLLPVSPPLVDVTLTWW
jgi:hypothetical protein